MPLTDIRKAAARPYDVCIIGAGPAGTAAALALSEAGHATLLIDAGAQVPVAGPGAGRTSPAAHAPLVETHCRAFGGTSWMWGGRIMPFSVAEFHRHSWPLDYDRYARHLDEAATFLGGSVLGKPFVMSDKAGSFDLDAVEMLASDGPVSQRHSARLEAATGPDILLSTTVVGLMLQNAPDGPPSCVGVRARLASGETIKELRARATVVAIGGVETARLLLADQTRHFEMLGHLNALGTSYSGHMTGNVSRITFPVHTDPRAFGWRSHTTGGFDRRVFRSTTEGVTAGMNMFFWAKNWPAEDAAHRSGILSAKYLVSRLWSRRNPKHASGPGNPEEVRPSQMGAHLRNLVSDASTSLWAAPDLIRATVNRSRRNLDHLIPNRDNCYKLCYHAEQEQRLDNRIELAGPVVADQLPDIRISYDFSDADVDSVIRGHAQLAQEMNASGLAELVYETDIDNLQSVVRQKARDGYHQIGTARMGRDVRDSVVNSNCEVHGLRGIYLSGSSIFRSSGSAPPTQSIVAFSLRLAHHLSEELQTCSNRAMATECMESEIN